MKRPFSLFFSRNGPAKRILIDNEKEFSYFNQRINYRFLDFSAFIYVLMIGGFFALFFLTKTPYWVYSIYFGWIIIPIVYTFLVNAYRIKLKRNFLLEQKILKLKKYDITKFKYAYLVNINRNYFKIKNIYENSFADENGDIRFMYPFVLMYSAKQIDEFDFKKLLKQKDILFVDYKILVNKTILNTNTDIKIYIDKKQLFNFKSEFLKKESEFFVDLFIKEFDQDRVIIK